MSRDLILNEIRRCKLDKAFLPDIDARQFSTGSNLKDAFARNVEAVGGKIFCVYDQKEIPIKISLLFPDAKEIISYDEHVDIGSIDVKKISTAHELDQLDLAVINAQFGVAENGAVWVSDKNFFHRAVPFIASHVAVILRQEDIVENMHDACLRMAGFDDGYGAFVSGPSKTADIEQSLVVGAQGPMSLTIFVVDPHPDLDETRR